MGGDISCNVGYGCGVVFKLVPNSNGEWRETVLHTFAADPGVNPSAAMIFDAAGNLFGTTLYSVFEITP